MPVKTKHKLKTKKLVIAIFLIAIILFSSFEIYRTNHTLEVSHYEIHTDQLNHEFRVVQLSDLHDSTFGIDNEDLVETVKTENPDLILITGDLVNSKKTCAIHKMHEADEFESNVDACLDTSMNLVCRLLKVAPVYISYGNQDLEVEILLGVSFKKLFDSIGAIVLEPAYLSGEKDEKGLEVRADAPLIAAAEKGYIDIDVKGQKIRIGGIYGYCLPEKYTQKNKWQDESAYLKEFQDTDLYTILMCHQPVCWIKNGSLYDWNIDTVFAGHVHGGQIILPKIGGVYAPDMGWFPGRLSGLFTTDEAQFDAISKYLEDDTTIKSNTSYCEKERLYEASTLVLSRGLGNTEIIPRINNIPEIVTVDFIPTP